MPHKKGGWYGERQRHSEAAKLAGARRLRKTDKHMDPRDRDSPPVELGKAHAGRISKMLRAAGIGIGSKPTGLAAIGTPALATVSWRHGGWVGLEPGLYTTDKEMEKAAGLLRKYGYKVTIQGIGMPKGDPGCPKTDKCLVIEAGG